MLSIFQAHLLKLVILSIMMLFCSSQVFAAKYFIRYNSDIVGNMHVVTAEKNDSFLNLARTYDVPFNAMVTANPKLNPWGPGTGNLVVIPGRFILPNVERKGIVINIAEFRIYYFPEDEPYVVHSYPIGIGEKSTPTPLLSTQVIEMQSDPTWHVPNSIRDPYTARGQYYPKTVPAGPGNPLGEYAIRLGLPSYLIHGTNQPDGVGMRVSHGCIRLYPEDIEDLFSRVTIDTPVQIIHQSYKTGWELGQMYLEVHQELLEYEKPIEDQLSNLVTTIQYQMLQMSPDVDMDNDEIRQVLEDSEGIPTKIGKHFPVSRMLN